MHDLKEKAVTALMHFFWIATIGIVVALIALSPIWLVALVYWMACLIVGATFTWVYPFAIGLLFLVMLALAWYEGDEM